MSTRRRIEHLCFVVLFAAVSSLLVAACSDDPDVTGQNTDQNVDENDPLYGAETHLRCHEGPPEGAEQAPEPPEYTGGECPTIEAGFNTIESSGHEREFMVVAPQDYDGSESLPVIFMWHWLAGDAEGFVERGEIQMATDTLRFLAVVPESLDDDPMQWPMTTAQSHDDERYQQELTFFDDMLSCVDDSYDINNQCVSSAGISAGALWTSQLASQRSDYLASFVALAGGVGAPGDSQAFVKPWQPAERKLPGIVLWGGPDDFCFIEFEDASNNLERHLEDDGHFFLECVHNCGHTKPPTDPEEGEAIMSGFWQFTLDHPRWVQEGTSPYTHEGLPRSMPEWCAIGRGNAEIREGECEPDQCA